MGGQEGLASQVPVEVPASHASGRCSSRKAGASVAGARAGRLAVRSPSHSLLALLAAVVSNTRHPILSNYKTCACEFASPTPVDGRRFSAGESRATVVN